MDEIYIKNRNASYINMYKLKRRMRRILDAVKCHKSVVRPSILDIGAADGMLLSYLKDALHADKAIGIEPSIECIRLSKSNDIELIQGAGESIPFEENMFDVIVAASVIDHLKDVKAFLKEAHRVLKPKGIVVVTAIVPFYDRMARISGLDKGLHPHVCTFRTKELKRIFEENNFNVPAAERFALPSFGILPFEDKIESLLRKLHLDFLMFYSLVVAQKA